jgi:AcrR family transcriptional regulator
MLRLASFLGYRIPMSVPPNHDRPRAGEQVPARADARRNWERLLTAAEALFVERGTEASLDEIARRAGVGIATLYRNFPTREALLAALLHDRFGSLIAKGERLLESPTPRAALEDWLQAIVEHIRTYQGLASSVAPTLCSASNSDLAPPCERMSGIGAALVQRAKDAGEIRADVVPSDVMVMANAVAWAAGYASNEPALVQRSLALLMDGLTATPAAKPAPTPRKPAATKRRAA